MPRGSLRYVHGGGRNKWRKVEPGPSLTKFPVQLRPGNFGRDTSPTAPEDTSAPLLAPSESAGSESQGKNKQQKPPVTVVPSSLWEIETEGLGTSIKQQVQDHVSFKKTEKKKEGMEGEGERRQGAFAGHRCFG